MILRPYQIQAVDELSNGFRKYHRQMLVLSTGGGKSAIFTEIIRRALLKGTKVLLITDRKELHKQAFRSVNKHSINICEITANNKNFDKQALLFVGMVETISRRINSIKNIDLGLIIVDEGHKSNFFKILDTFPNVRAIAFTATPINKKLHLYYQNIVCSIQISELIKQGYLVQCKGYQMQDDFSDLEVKNGEYTDESQYLHFKKTSLYKGVLEKYYEKLQGLKTIIFCVNIQHVMDTYKLFKDANLPTYYVHSNMPDKDRDLMIKSFEEDMQGIIINAGIMVAGYDHPPIMAGMSCLKTKSLIKWMQMLGRASRPYREKDNFIWVDFGCNFDEHGLFDTERKWTLDPPKKKSNKIGAAPIKKCTNCEAVISARALVCEFCGFEFPKKDNELKEGILVEVKSKIPNGLEGKRLSELNTEELILLQNSKVYKSSYIWRIVRSKGEDSIKDYAYKLGYKKGWIHRQIKDIENSGFSDKVIN